MTTSYWRDRATCATYDPELWFPGPTDVVGLRYAAQICFSCPVRQECLIEQLEAEAGKDPRMTYGVYGGLSPVQRSILRQAYQRKRPRPPGRGKPPAPCGTSSAYERHMRNNEPIDEACRAWKEGQARQVPPAPCGTRTAYSRHKSRGEAPCDPCRLAYNEHRRQYQRQRTTAATWAANSA